MNDKKTPESTPKKKQQRKLRAAGEWAPVFIVNLRETGNVRLSCQKAGIDRVTAYNYRDRNQTFAKQWHDALEDAIDTLEAAARCRALETSDVLLIFLLKSHRPKVYADRMRHEHAGPGAGPIAINTIEAVAPAAVPSASPEETAC